MFTLTMTGSMAYPTARRVLMTERGNHIQYASYADAEAAARDMLARHPDWYDGFEITPEGSPSGTYCLGRVYGIYSDATTGDDLAWERSTYFTAEDAMREAQTIWQDEHHQSRRVWVEYNTAHDDEQHIILDLPPAPVTHPEPDGYIRSYTEHGCWDRYIDDAAAVDAIGPYAWPGGYAIFYLGQDGENGELVTLCPDCTKRELVEGDVTRAFVRNGADDDDAYNGTGIQCESCNDWIVEHDAEEYAKNFDADGNDLR